MGARANAARAEVVAAREGLDEALVQLEASGRAAVDIPARLRREPAKVAGAAAGAVFLLAGGPGRVLRRARRAIFGPSAGLPKSMLPKEVEKTLKKLGDDGDAVRGTLEREFAAYLDEKAPERKDRDLKGALVAMGVSLLRPASIKAGRELAERFFDPDRPSFTEGLKKARDRRRDDGVAGPTSVTSNGTGGGGPTTPAA